MVSEPLDGLDRQILHLLQQDARHNTGHDIGSKHAFDRTKNASEGVAPR
ncbi:hypothetical protein C448_03166 [Halococcus morrhuae DSM 1307]|uniref:Uncharacterized protein n=2 Tax=Halococcus TaxID=2249 RepID=M0MS50_HALMO|nr:Lrp/AsnC family transcriptional regulator [Halococcus dombrowskii]EMA48532.1 hypothetical protein C448_03166 [Halococcus morrhuae DSM 1307]UOO97481.1 Lrp/AsnC family transcriptional regulator [Halococcus dombrowskii]